MTRKRTFAAATPKSADVAHHASRASELACVQIEMGRREARSTPAVTRLLRERVFTKHRVN